MNFTGIQESRFPWQRRRASGTPSVPETLPFLPCNCYWKLRVRSRPQLAPEIVGSPPLISRTGQLGWSVDANHPAWIGCILPFALSSTVDVVRVSIYEVYTSVVRTEKKKKGSVSFHIKIYMCTRSKFRPISLSMNTLFLNSSLSAIKVWWHSWVVLHERVVFILHYVLDWNCSDIFYFIWFRLEIMSEDI